MPTQTKDEHVIRPAEIAGGVRPDYRVRFLIDAALFATGDVASAQGRIGSQVSIGDLGLSSENHVRCTTNREHVAELSKACRRNSTLMAAV